MSFSTTDNSSAAGVTRQFVPRYLYQYPSWLNHGLLLLLSVFEYFLISASDALFGNKEGLTSLKTPIYTYK